MSAVVEKTILEELRAIREALERIEALLEERLIGIEEPLPDEVEAIKEYEADKKSDRVKLVKLEDVLRGSEAE
ncbi:MAG: hypothetical protein J7J99_02755 [Thermoprotei archaeon]|nr:hypothetical protein [Thermoprotei archaeon]